MFGILLLLGRTAGLSAQSVQPTGFIPLFDGKTLNTGLWITPRIVSYEAQAFGSTVVAKMNGLVVGRDENVYPKGKLGIQCEVNTVVFRNIQIREGTQ